MSSISKSSTEALDQANGEKAKDTWSDRETEKISDDRFGFEAYANILADRIPKVDTPLTIGIYGQWGSGKSSLMKMTQDLLKCEEIESPRECIWINVWQLSSQDEVWQAFLQALFSAVQNKLTWWQRIDKRKLLWQIGGSLLRFALIAAPLIIGLYIGSEATQLDELATDAIAAGGTVATLGLFLLTAARIGPILDAFRQTWKVDLQAALKGGSYEARISELTKLQGQFAAMVKLLVGKEGKLIVFIDDLDRCTPDKVPEVLEAIKLFTTTPGCVYIIGLDHDIVRQGIEAKYDFPTPEAATEYLEKIVQVPFHLLPLDQGRVERFIEDYYNELPRQSCAAEVFSKGLEPNPRKIKRALNIYRMLLDLKDIRFQTWEMDEVDEELVAKMVVIQNRFRRLHGHLERDSDFLLKVEKRAMANDGLSVQTLIGDDDVGKLLLGQKESKDSEAKEGLVETTGLDALNRLLNSGQKKFNDPDQVLKIDSYIYLIATVEGGAEGLQPNREDRDILLSGDRPRIREHLDLILNRGGADEQIREQIRTELVKRLDFCVKDSRNSFSQEQRASAKAALERLALMPLVVADQKVIRKRLEEILVAAPDENAREQTTIREQLELIPAAGPDAAERQDTYESLIGPLRAAQEDTELYTPGEQALARSAQVMILYMRLFGELPAFDDNGEDPLGLDLDATIGKLSVVMEGSRSYADSEVTLAQDILEVILGENLLAKINSGDPAQLTAALTQLEQQEADLQGPLHRWAKVRLKAIMIDESQTIPARAGAGDALALLGDDRPGVGTVDRIGTHLPDIVWGEEVPAGKYKIGGDSNSYDAYRAREVEIIKPYRLARYLVTHAQFQCFLEAPDFADPRWWKEIPQEEQEEGEQAWPLANRPREQVSWYQAMAFCRWLGDKLGEEIDLPHEYEWEVAARYPDGRFYPWGNDFEATKANTDEGGLRQTTAVGIFPEGANPTLKLYDLSGNVWEWCRNKYDKPDEPWLDKDPVDGSGDSRSLRGGSWGNISASARAASRYYVPPANRGNYNGFRVVVRRPSQGT